MPRFSVTAGVIAICCLAGGAGCCCCQRGFSVSGDWSLQMDRLPNDCGHGGCPHGHCLHGHGDEAIVESTVPATTPKFHPLPTEPVGDATAPHVAGPPLASSTPDASDQSPQRTSVLKREPTPASGSSSWMFVRRGGPSNAPPDLAQRRQLSAEAWTTTRRR